MEPTGLLEILLKEVFFFTRGEVKLRSPKETRQTKKQYVVQGHIPDRPTWGEDLNIQKYIKDVSLGRERGEDEGGE